MSQPFVLWGVFIFTWSDQPFVCVASAKASLSRTPLFNIMSGISLLWASSLFSSFIRCSLTHLDYMSFGHRGSLRSLRKKQQLNVYWMLATSIKTSLKGIYTSTFILSGHIVQTCSFVPLFYYYSNIVKHWDRYLNLLLDENPYKRLKGAIYLSCEL